MKPHWLVSVVLLACAAQAEPARTAAVVTKVLGFERTLADRVTTVVKVSLVYREGDRAGENDARELEAAFKTLAAKLKGAPVEAFASSTAAPLAADADAVVFCGADGPAFDAVAAAARDKSLLTIGLERAHAQRFASLAVFADGAQVKIAVNIQNSKAARLQLNSSLMRVAEAL